MVVYRFFVTVLYSRHIPYVNKDKIKIFYNTVIYILSQYYYYLY